MAKVQGRTKASMSAFYGKEKMVGVLVKNCGIHIEFVILRSCKRLASDLTVVKPVFKSSGLWSDDQTTICVSNFSELT